MAEFTFTFGAKPTTTAAGPPPPKTFSFGADAPSSFGAHAERLTAAMGRKKATPRGLKPKPKSAVIPDTDTDTSAAESSGSEPDDIKNKGTPSAAEGGGSDPSAAGGSGSEPDDVLPAARSRRTKGAPSAAESSGSEPDDILPAARPRRTKGAPSARSQSAFNSLFGSGGLFAARDAPSAPKPKPPPAPNVAAPKPKTAAPARPIRNPFERRVPGAAQEYAAPAPAPASAAVDISTADLSAIMRRVNSARRTAAAAATTPPGQAQAPTTPAGWPLGFSVGPVLAPIPVPVPVPAPPPPPALGIFASLAPADKMAGFRFEQPAEAEPQDPPSPSPPGWYSLRQPIAVASPPPPGVMLSPQRVDSPQLGYSPPVVLGPQRVDSPQRALSPLGFLGPQQAPSGLQPIHTPPVRRPVVAPQPPPAPPLATPLASTTTTTTIPSTTTLPPLRPHLTAPTISLDELTTTWTHSLETHTALFAQHAAAIRRLDNTLHTHHSAIDALSLSATTADHGSSTLDRALDALAADQSHLAEVLAWYDVFLDTELAGSAAAAAAAVDAEREGIVRMALALAEGVDAVVAGGAEMVAAVNGVVGVWGGPLNAIVRILNDHLSALEWIDGHTAALNAKIADAQGNIPDLGADGDGDEEMRRMFCGE